MRVARTVFILVFLIAMGATAQEVKFPVDLERLAAKATEVVDVNMDASMLQFASKFLDKEGDAEAKGLISGLKAIYVRSFEFAKPGEYTEQDVESLRAQLKAPVWSRMIGVRSQKQGENADVYFKMENGKVMGLAIIAAEPLELTFVHIDGPIDPEKLEDLSGHFGVPKVDMPKAKPGKTPAKSSAKPPTKPEEE